jgi:uncharacterized protein YndB with AHSA1/START domain
MIASKETIVKKDPANKKIRIEREFDAPVEQVWKAYTDSDMLDQWWAPRPWKAGTKSMDLRPGGAWLYYMEGPDGSRHFAKVAYEKVEPNKSFSAQDSFTDENGTDMNGMPSMHWDLAFKPSGNGTKVETDITFSQEEDMTKILEMGFEEGFTMAQTNLDELLAKK